MHGFVGVDGSWGAQHLVYGLGLMQDVMGVGPDYTGQPRSHEQGLVRGHTGALVGYRSAMWYLPESGVTIAVGVNQMYYDANKIVTPVMDAILAYNEQIAQP
jgi:CubicO group peptidase (beta-lactamase class C family)